VIDQHRHVEEIEFVDARDDAILLGLDLGVPAEFRIRAMARAKSASDSTAPSSLRKLKRAPRTPASCSLAR